MPDVHIMFASFNTSLKLGKSFLRGRRLENFGRETGSDLKRGLSLK